jgi:serine/threonine-protein kinase
MAIVYLATDLRHLRQVALKVMRPEVALSIGSQRFLREIQIAAGLAHPRIVSVFDSGETDGTIYYVMPFIDAPSLRQRLDQSGRLPADQAVGIARDIARALGYAHARGIVHRDIKPENIMLPAGEAVVTDFGVARRFDHQGDEPSGSALTEAGLVVGTPDYLSPEQVGGEASPKSDVYALGCVLYEMLSGVPPYRSPSPLATLARHGTAPIPRLEQLDPPPPGWLQPMVERALAKDPADRPTAEALAAELEAGAAREPRGQAAEPGPRPDRLTIAVLPFTDLSEGGTLGWAAAGIAEELQTALAAIPGLRAIPSTTAAMLRRGTDALTVRAGRIGVDYLIDGSLRAAGERLRVAVQLVRTSDGAQLWSRRLDGSTSDVFEIEDRIASAVLDAIAIHRDEATRPGSPSLPGPPSHPDAHRYLLLGRQALGGRTAAGFHQAVELFGRAAELDPALAAAPAGLAEAHLLAGIYGMMAPGRAVAGALATADRALSLQPGLPEALTVRASLEALGHWAWADAEIDFLAVLGRTVVPPAARQRYALYLLAPLGRLPEARAQLELARRDDPLSPALSASLGQVALFDRRVNEAIAWQRTALELDSSFAPAHLFLGQALAEAGDFPAALHALAEAERVGGRTAEVIAARCYAEGRAGRRAQAEALLAELGEAGADDYRSPVLAAIGWAGLGEVERGVAALETAAAEGALDLVWVAIRPALAPLAADPRVVALKARLGLSTA